MVTIGRRLRRATSSQPKENLELVRERVRETLSRPYVFVPKTHLTKPWELDHPDPTVGYFKPFSEVRPLEPFDSAQGKEVQVVTFSQPHLSNYLRLLVLPGTLLLLLAGVWAWKNISSSGVVVSPIPTSTQVGSPATSLEEAVIPPGTSLDSGGPYTGTGGPEPEPLDPEYSTSNTLTIPGGNSVNISGDTQIVPTTSLP